MIILFYNYVIIIGKDTNFFSKGKIIHLFFVRICRREGVFLFAPLRKKMYICSDYAEHHTIYRETEAAADDGV